MEVLCARIPNISVYPIRKEFAAAPGTGVPEVFCLRHVHDITTYYNLFFGIYIPLPETNIAPLKHCFFFKMSFLLGHLIRPIFRGELSRDGSIRSPMCFFSRIQLDGDQISMGQAGRFTYTGYLRHFAIIDYSKLCWEAWPWSKPNKVCNPKMETRGKRGIRENKKPLKTNGWRAPKWWALENVSPI